MPESFWGKLAKIMPSRLNSLKIFFRSSAIIIALAMLSACFDLAEENFVENGERFFEINDRVSAMPFSSPNVVQQTTGSASFDGAALMGCGPQHHVTVLAGDATVHVNFDGLTYVSGNIRNLAGVADTNVVVAGSGPFDNYSGQIDLYNGAVGASNSVSVGNCGALIGNGDTIVMNGTMNGEFRGNGVIRAIDLADRSSGSVNGSDRSIGVTVLAER